MHAPSAFVHHTDTRRSAVKSHHTRGRTRTTATLDRTSIETVNVRARKKVGRCKYRWHKELEASTASNRDRGETGSEMYEARIKSRSRKL